MSILATMFAPAFIISNALLDKAKALFLVLKLCKIFWQSFNLKKASFFRTTAKKIHKQRPLVLELLQFCLQTEEHH